MIFLKDLLLLAWLVLRTATVWMLGLGIFLLPGGLVLLMLLGAAWRRMSGQGPRDALPESGAMPAAAQLSPGNAPPVGR